MDSLSRLKNRRRRPVSLDEATRVRTQRDDSPGTPVIMTPAHGSLNLLDWAPRHRQEIQNALKDKGGVLFRDFKLDGIDAFGQLVHATFDKEPLSYTYRSTVRSQVQGKVYTSTEYPQERTIPQHHENAYTTTWPEHLYFYCVTQPNQGGETPLADGHTVYRLIDPAIRARFEAKGVMYVRNYHRDMDIPWQIVFQTENPTTVDRYCAARGIACIWKPDGSLQTRQVCQGTIAHPLDGRMLWFNQAHLFHVTNLEPEIATSMLADYGEENLPRNAYYGDGSSIEPETLNAIRAAYDEALTTFPWRQGDVLLLDNMRLTHGRKPFSGPRKILVGMSGAWSLGENGEAVPGALPERAAESEV